VRTNMAASSYGIPTHEVSSSSMAKPDRVLGFKTRRVLLNVGGSRFETTRETLTRYADSFFGVMFSGREGIEVPTDDQGYAFIDRDGTHFRSILNFLRSGLLALPKDPVEEKLLWEELRYYMLEPYVRREALLGSRASPSSGKTQDAAAAAPAGSPALVPTKVLQVLPSMGAVTAYALAWEANRQTISQCSAEAQRETGGMVELVPLANDASLSFPLAEKHNVADKRVNPNVVKWFNPMLPLWRRVRELQQQGYVLSSVHCGPESTVSFVVLNLPSAGQESPTAGALPECRLLSAIS